MSWGAGERLLLHWAQRSKRGKKGIVYLKEQTSGANITARKRLEAKIKSKVIFLVM